MSFFLEYFKKFQLAKYQLSLRAQENLILPIYKGGTLRGGFGYTFRRLCCINKKRESCKECPLKERCPYGYVFATQPPEGSKVLRTLSDIPRPFVIEPPLDTKSVYSQGATLEFNLILIGKAIDYLPYFILTFKELGTIGIGKDRGKYELSEVCDLCHKKIYDSKDDTIRNSNSRIPLNELSVSHLLQRSSLAFSFITPTRIKFQQDLVVTPEFHVILRALLHRLSSLSYFHCGSQLDIDYKSLICQAEKVKIKESSLNWTDWERYSSRQKTRMKLGGFVGKITYTGRFEYFLPLLLAGQYTHIGKNCTFGLGKYEIIGG